LIFNSLNEFYHDMRIFKPFDRKITLFLALFLLVLFLSVFTGFNFTQNYSDTRILRELQNSILQKDQKLSLNLEKISATLKNNPDSCFEMLSDLEKKYDDDGSVFFILKNDSLIYWSNNSTPILSFLKHPPAPVINTGNAWYRVITKEINHYKIVGMYLIKHQFAYQNEYLRNSFQKSFSLPYDAVISLQPSDNSIYNVDQKFLFSVKFFLDLKLGLYKSFLLLFLYLLTLLFFIGFLYQVYSWYYFKTKYRLVFIIGFIFDVILLRVILFYFHIPKILYTTKLFSPQYYANSDYLPSIGDFFINAVFLLILSYFIYRQIKFDLKFNNIKLLYRLFSISSLFLLVFLLFKGVFLTFESLVFDSNISMDLNNIYSISSISIFNFLIISIILLTFFLFTSKLCYIAFRLSRNILLYLSVLIPVTIIIIIFCRITKSCDPTYLLLAGLYVASFPGFFHYRKARFSVTSVAFYLIYFSVFSTYSLYKYNDYKEHEYRKLLAVTLATEQRDLLAEFLVKNLTYQLQNDSQISKHLASYNTSQFDDKPLKKYVVEKYFTGYWKKYNQQITICDDKDLLMVQPENVAVPCDHFFDNMIKNMGHSTENDNMFFINYNPGDNGYLIIFRFVQNGPSHPLTINIFVELTGKYVESDLGFPDLLVDQSIAKNPDLTNYSYAKYQNGELFKRVGKYYYNTSNINHGIVNQQFTFYNQDGYSHLYYKFDNEKDLIISKKENSFMDILAPFSYAFLFLSLFVILVYFLFVYPFSRHSFHLNFRTRVQISMASVILFSFLVIGIFTLYYINNLNEQKNKDILNEKTLSVLVELQQKLLNENELHPGMVGFVNDLLVKFSNVFFTDINLFDLQGNLYSTSRPQIYDEFLISRKMNTTAYRELTYKKSSLFIQTEHIGEQYYLSAYLPFVNDQNKVVAYLNLPYFAKQNDLKREISTFLVAYINIYVVLIALSILIALIISNYIARPIKLIMSKLGHLNLGGHNEKITWTRKDEIGQLVVEYNRMIDELALSAELLAKSERETAWREMAKQVAHEIKNPLTPMKLSVQYLQKAWNESASGWDNRLEKFTQTMIEQIDTLSVIASEFSDFAKMPDSHKIMVDVSEIIQNSISLFKNYTNIQIGFYPAEKLQYFIFADKEQLLRAFNNLLKNAVQAIGETNAGKIDIRISKHDKSCHIEIFDSGKGISKEFTEKIFSPNFTTKSGGTGLGLAIVKNIIISSGGEISFESVPRKGTTFKIRLPLS